MNKIKKLLVCVLSLVTLLSCFSLTVSAAAKTSVSLSSHTINVGEQLKVTVTFNADEVFYGASGYLQYNPEVLEHNPSNTSDSKFGADVAKMVAEGGSNKTSVTLTFTAKKSGSSNLRVYGCTYAIDEEFPLDGTSTSVNVIDKSKLSGNANLKSMILSNDIPLNPAFNKDITTYNVTVENSVEKVLINAAAEENGANVAYGGSTKMKVGDNQRWVTVTAPNGTQKKYTINIKRLAPDEVISDPNTPTVNPYEVKIGEQTWVLVSEYTDEIKLGGFTVASAMINEFELPVLKSETTGEIVVFARLAGEEGKTAYFTFNSLTGEFKEYRLYNAAAGTIVLLPFESNLVLPNGYYKANATVGAYNIEVIKYNDAVFADFVIVYAQSSLGNKEYYRIDLKDNSVQRLPDFASKLEKAQSMANGTVITRFIALSNTEKIMICAIALAVVLLIVLIVILIIRLVRGIAYRQADEITDLDELEELEDFEEEEEIEEDEEDENF